jgi:hypothetical protein
MSRFECQWCDGSDMNSDPAPGKWWSLGGLSGQACQQCVHQLGLMKSH